MHIYVHIHVYKSAYNHGTYANILSIHTYIHTYKHCFYFSPPRYLTCIGIVVQDLDLGARGGQPSDGREQSAATHIAQRRHLERDHQRLAHPTEITHIHTYINVSYEHRYVPERSRKGQYFFTYCMRMSMLGDGPQAHVLKSTLLYSNNNKFHVLHSHVRDGPQAHVLKRTLYIVPLEEEDTCMGQLYI